MLSLPKSLQILLFCITMKTCVLVFVSLVLGASAIKWDALKVTWKSDSDQFYDLPWTVKEAKECQVKWLKIDDDKNLNLEVYSQPEDPSVMLLFDKKENIAGIRMAFLKDDVAKKAISLKLEFKYDYDNNAMFEKGRYFKKDLWYNTVLFASPEKLIAGGRSLLNKEVDEIAEGLWFKPEGKWIEISKDECKTTEGFVEAKCYPKMGKHYFYKFEKNQCTLDKPFFALYNEGKLVGFGLMGYGSYTKNPDTRNFFEELPVPALKSMFPATSDCLKENIDKYGISVMHVYLKKDAAKITCPAEEFKAKNC